MGQRFPGADVFTVEDGQRTKIKLTQVGLLFQLRG